MPFTIGDTVRVKKFDCAGTFKGYAAITGFCAVQLAGESHPITVSTEDVVEIPKPARMPAWLTED